MPWDLNGNAIAPNNFLGTTNKQPLVVATNHKEALRVDTEGNVGIGTTSTQFNSKLTVFGTDTAVLATSENGPGVDARSTLGIALEASTQFTTAVYAHSRLGRGVDARSQQGIALEATATKDTAVFAHSDTARGVDARTGGNNAAVIGQCTFSSIDVDSAGVYGLGPIGVKGQSIRSPEGFGVWGFNPGGLAGVFSGNVAVHGWLSVDGKIFKQGGGFRIDHPQDPANKYLYHSFVESPDMKNVYDGIVTLNSKGEAKVKMPRWFEALNRDFRYQLTALGAPAPNLYIAKGISKNTFAIAGGKPKMKVSWQVTGIRKDPWAEKNRVGVEENKPTKERGYYLDPKAYGQPEKKDVSWARHPMLTEQVKEATRPAKAKKR